MKKHIKNTAIVIACVFAGSLYFGNAQRGGRQGDAEWLNFLAENGGDPRGELTAAKASELLFNGCNYTTPAIYVDIHPCLKAQDSHIMSRRTRRLTLQRAMSDPGSVERFLIA